MTRGEDYRQVVRTGNRVGGAFCITYAVPRSVPEDTALPARFGYIISKAVGNAVVRNRVRRRMKSISEELIGNGVIGVDVVFRALPKAANASFDELKKEMLRSIERLRAQR